VEALTQQQPNGGAAFFPPDKAKDPWGKVYTRGNQKTEAVIDGQPVTVSVNADIPRPAACWPSSPACRGPAPGGRLTAAAAPGWSRSGAGWPPSPAAASAC
jgi:hypothetical protein